MAHSFKRAVIKNTSTKKKINSNPDIIITQPEPEINNKASAKSNNGFGFHQWINFGEKWNRKTVYDVANKRDFGFLKWLLGQTDKESRFWTNPNMFPHIHAALRLQDEPLSEWKLYWTDLGEDHFVLQYQTESGLQGPPINYKMCTKCNKKKMSLLFENDNDTCHVCCHQ